jgi:hypothetical protein
VTIKYEWRGDFDNAALNTLHADGFGHQVAGTDWRERLERHSLGWVCAWEDGMLIGFVNVVWDGGVHAFILDTVVAQHLQRRGVGAARSQLQPPKLVPQSANGSTSTSRSTCVRSTSTPAGSRRRRPV